MTAVRAFCSSYSNLGSNTAVTGFCLAEQLYPCALSFAIGAEPEMTASPLRTRRLPGVPRMEAHNIIRRAADGHCTVVGDLY